MFKGRRFERQPSSNRSDEGLSLQTLAFKLFTVANLRYQLSCQH